MAFRALIFDIDGVITDGKVYTDGQGHEFKTINYKDLDAITSIKENGVVVGCISGEDTPFSKMIAEKLDFAKLGCKNKNEAIDFFLSQYNDIELSELCYIGDGKYDIPVLQKVGLSIAPQDAIYEVRKIVDRVLDSNGGTGCLAEIFSVYFKSYEKGK